MRAAERLFAEQGIASVSVRAIVAAAGARNESALHYHFGGRDGLIAALHLERSAEVEAERARVLEALLAHGRELDLRGIAVLMVRPAFQLAGRDPGFRNYLKVFAHLVLFSSRRLTELLAEHQDRGVTDIRARLRRALPELPDALFEMRLEQAARFATLSMSQHARERKAFRGRHAELFFENLVDSIAGLLASAPSAATLRLLD